MGFLIKNSDSYDYILSARRPRPIDPSALPAMTIADALQRLSAAERELRHARANVPSYTAQWSDEDYYAEEQEEYNRAVEYLAEAFTNFKPYQPQKIESEHQKYMSQKISDVLPNLTAKEKAFCDDLTYIGDIIRKLEKKRINVFSFKSMDVLRAIPPRLGLEDWIRPESDDLPIT